MRVKDWIKSLNKLPIIERFLAKKCQGRSLNNFWVKLLPPIYSYPKNSLRKVRRNGINYDLDISDYHGYKVYFGLNVEPGVHTLLSQVKNGMTVIDVGTNIGEVLLNISKLNPHGQNIGFEPVRESYEMAVRNIGLNHFENVIIYNLALSNKVEEVFYEIPSNRNRGSVQMTKKEGKCLSRASAVSLDSFVQENGLLRIDLIKIDAEGFEYIILEGANHVIEKFKPLLFIEVNDLFLKKNGSSAIQLITYLLDKGYTIVNAETLGPVAKSNDYSEPCDIFCTPLEHEYSSLLSIQPTYG